MCNSLDDLPDDLVFAILRRLAASAASPSDLAAVRVTCKRLNQLGLDPCVLQMASVESLAIRADKWSESAHRFLNRCVDAGNLEACYIMGMIQFYCLGNRQNGALLMVRAAHGKNPAALFSLAVIAFNGSGASEAHRNIQAGLQFCVLAASYGHVSALLEIGYYFTHGAVAPEDADIGIRLIIMATLRKHHAFPYAPPPYTLPTQGVFSFLHHFWWTTSAPEPHPANRFLVDWFLARGGVVSEGEQLRLCSYRACGRPETRPNEFRVCYECLGACHCSRACHSTVPNWWEHIHVP